MQFYIKVIFLYFMLFTPAMAHEIELPHVTVYGTATTEVTPDEMRWSISIRNKSSSLDKVGKEHIQIVEEALNFLRQQKIEKESLQSSRMEFGENWEYRSGSNVMDGYFASTIITFKLTDLGKYEKLWLGLAAIKNLSVQNVQYENSKRIAHQNDTRKKALLAAKEKASVMAETLGSGLGEPLFVEEILDEYPRGAGNWLSNGLDSAGSSSTEEALAPGKIPVRIRVKAAFRLVSK